MPFKVMDAELCRETGMFGEVSKLTGCHANALMNGSHLEGAP